LTHIPPQQSGASSPPHLLSLRIPSCRDGVTVSGQIFRPCQGDHLVAYLSQRIGRITDGGYGLKETVRTKAARKAGRAAGGEYVVGSSQVIAEWDRAVGADKDR